ncbi:MAG: hypothetical protein HONDAALG_02230 [Gammaproteobacteria bacterium]|nr:hypothetical protein [Gammaproteobacteria bacterium]
MSPSDTTWVKPMPLVPAQSMTAVHRAPDCATKASEPGCAAMCAKLAFMRMPGLSRPTQFGPRIRRPCGRAASSRAWRGVAPDSPKPALMTMAALVPWRPSASMRPATVAAGVQMTARSGLSGRLATSGQAFSPWISSCFGLTGKMAPA